MNGWLTIFSITSLSKSKPQWLWYAQLKEGPLYKTRRENMKPVPFWGRNPTFQSCKKTGLSKVVDVAKNKHGLHVLILLHASSLPLLISTAVMGLQSNSLFTAFPESICFWWKLSLMRFYCAISAGVYHLKGTILIPTFALQYEL